MSLWTSLNLRPLGLGGQTVKNLRANLILTKVSASHRKSTQVHARPGQTESQVDPGFQLAATGLRLRLARALYYCTEMKGDRYSNEFYGMMLQHSM